MISDLQRMPLLDDFNCYVRMTKEEMDDFCVQITHCLLEELYPASLEDQKKALRKVLDQKMKDTFASYAYLPMSEDERRSCIHQIRHMNQDALVRGFAQEIPKKLLEDFPEIQRTQMAWKVIMDVTRATNPDLHHDLQLWQKKHTGNFSTRP